MLWTIAIATTLGWAACSGGRNATTADYTPPLHYDGEEVSELALLMRAMAAHADSVKAAIARGAKTPAKPAGIEQLLTATPTPGMHIDPITFPTFGKDYQAKVEALYKAKGEGRTAAYNALVQSCANCHGTHCPGPLMRIRNMYLTAGS
jgi:hypothetical protein